jgi:ADP-ribose pyrophosphatase
LYFGGIINNDKKMFSISNFLTGIFRWVSSDRSSKSVCHMHVKCRNAVYPQSKVQRFSVPDDKVDWAAAFPEYKPVKYTAEKVLQKPVWADPDFTDQMPPADFWNKLDKANNVDRTSLTGDYKIVDGLPRNPVGRTGITGRGQLGRWGPNHAADPIVTRWKSDENGKRVTHKSTGKSILQFVAIQRTDSGEWALPGGMVDPGEVVKTTLKREFMEEAMNSLETCKSDNDQHEKFIDKFFSKHDQIYAGYVDDPRNTDNAWMETIAYNFHDETGEFVGNLQLSAGDDAASVQWMDIDHSIQLYASHSNFIRQVVELRNCHW